MERAGEETLAREELVPGQAGELQHAREGEPHGALDHQHCDRKVASVGDDLTRDPVGEALGQLDEDLGTLPVQVVQCAFHREPMVRLGLREERLVDAQARVMGEDVRLEYPLEPGRRHAAGSGVRGSAQSTASNAESGEGRRGEALRGERADVERPQGWAPFNLIGHSFTTHACVTQPMYDCYTTSQRPWVCRAHVDSR